MAWGDLDGDSDLDLALGNYGPNRVYQNSGGSLALAWSSSETNQTESVAWGDWDSDGDLDLAVGNSAYYDDNCECYINEANQVYANNGSSLTLAWSSPETDYTTSVAWGDWDGDGDLDLAVGNDGQSNRVYANNGVSLTLAWSSSEMDLTKSVAWGDWDGDSDLDLAVGNGGYYDSDCECFVSEPNRVYRNDGGDLTLAWFSSERDRTYSVAWGDWDGDGDLDLATGNLGQSNRVYANDSGSLILAWSSPETDWTESVAWGDWDSDGDLDLAVQNIADRQPDRIYANSGGSLALVWSIPMTDYSSSLAWGDLDGDNDLDLVIGTWGSPSRVYHNRSLDDAVLPDSITRAQITYLDSAAAPFFASATIFDGPTLPITYTLFDPEGDPARFVEAYYSLDGGSQWHPAVAAAGTVTTNLAASSTGTVHTYTWDILSSGVFGASDSTVFRLDVYQGFTAPGPYQHLFRTAQMLPFRVRGSQVRVISGTVPVSQATVYRQPADYPGFYQPYSNNADQPFHTNSVGYLQGRGEIAPGDRLAALLSVAATDSYTLYYASASPALTGLEAYTVTAPGVQTLTVSTDNPLVLFDLDVSLEWDVRQDTIFLDQLNYDLQRTSELLYDWTNGQVALGQITVYHEQEHWNDAHIRVYASNRVRPNAYQGGIVSQIITDPLASDVTYVPGQVRIGATWNRYGDPGGSLGEDWPRTLAHELGHYALFLNDNYLGLDAEGHLISVDSCTGTAMTDPYHEDYSEFHPDEDWLPGCERTLSHQSTGRSDWATITTFYPWLRGTPTNPGPSRLPLAVTQIQFVEPITPSTALEVPIFYLSQDGGRVQPGSNARAFLLRKEGDQLIDLGRPTLDRVLARGAREGDQLCVFELSAQRLGCEAIQPGDEELELVALPGWQPEVIISPVTSRTIALTVTNVPAGLALNARLFPVSAPASPTATLVVDANGYAGQLHLEYPAFEGHVQVWVDEGMPHRETITDYAMGGNPGRKLSHFAPRGSPGRKLSHFAPVLSADGQVMLFGEGLTFEEGEFFTLQAATTLPSPPPWTTVVGRTYRLSASPNAPDLSGTSISFGYLGSEVPPGEEGWLKVYFWDGDVWHPLSTRLDTYHNVASAPIQGAGLYALMSSIEIPLYGPGWNLFSYPVETTRPVTEALLSISGYYTTVYGYDATDPGDPWKVYDVTAPDWVNDLEVLEFGHGYWVNVSETVTLFLKGASDDALQRAQDTTLTTASNIPSPPATYYGEVLDGPSFGATIGLPVMAWVDGNLCGQSWTREVRDQVVYTVNVFAEAPAGRVGCGMPGRTVTFKVGSQTMRPTAVWDNSGVWELALSSDFRVYLPLVIKEH
jgi:hypothetical protein